METLSTTSSLTTTFHVPKQPKHHHHNHLKPTTHHHHHNHHSTTISSTLHQNYPFTPLKTKTSSSSSSFPPTLLLPRKTSTHTSAASGYAAALLDISQRNDTVLKVVRDARRLLRVLGSDHVVEFMMDEVVHDYDKGKIVKDVLDKGKFEVNFVVLVKLVVDKGKKVDFVKEVLVEFLRVFSQLLTSSSSKSSYVSQTTRLSMGNI